MHVYLSNSRRNLTLLSIAVACLFGASIGWADTYPFSDKATGDWNGVRARMVEAGITPLLFYDADLLSNPVGGQNQSAAYAASLLGELTFDLEKIIGSNGLSFHISVSWDQGRDLSQDDIGNYFIAAETYVDNVLRLAKVYFEQDLWHDNLQIKLGKIPVGDGFASDNFYANYVNAAVNPNPLSLQNDVPSFTSDPLANLGIQASVSSDTNLYLSAGVFNADPSVQAPHKHGLDFSMDLNRGVLMIGEFGYDVDYLEGQGRLPGHFAVGAFMDTGKYENLNNPENSSYKNFGYYVMGRQMVYQEHGEQGLSLWAVATLFPKQGINAVPFAAYGGLSYKGLFPTRDEDITAAAAYLAQFSEELEGQNFELVWEVNHRVQFTKWSYLTADLQYISNPSGRGDIDDAVVVGLEFLIDF